MLLGAEAFGQARKEFQAAIALDVDDEAAWQGFIKTAPGTGRDQLQMFLEEMLKKHPSTIVRSASAEFYAGQNDYPRAIELFDSLLKDDPNDIRTLEKFAEVLANHGSARLAEITDRLLSLDPGNAPGLYHRATIRLYQGRADEAIQAVKRSLESDPLNIRARNLLAIAYGQTFQPQLADAEFQRALNDAPQDWMSYNNYGLFLLERTRFTEAGEKFRRAISLNPENVQGFVGVGEVLRQSGDMRGAQVWYRKALRLDPNQAVARQYVQ
jgi:Tfp pilus assembly protein PilF